MMNLSSLSKTKIIISLSLVLSIILALYALTHSDILDFIFMTIFFVFTLFSFIFIKKTEKEIHRVTDICKDLAKGDFSKRIIYINEKGDIGELLNSINYMTDFSDAYIRESMSVMEYVSRNQYFRRILEDGLSGNLLNAAKIINKATNNVEEKMNSFVNIGEDVDTSLTSIVKTINGTVDTLTSTVNVMSSTVHKTRKGANSAVAKSNATSQNVQTIASAAEEMSSAIAEVSVQISRTSDLSKNAVDSSEDSKNIMDQLVESSKKIGAVVELIEKIAEKTNLLALNATIEAARAGEAGKGFAVVASEVKTLAGQTAKATDEVNEHITSIRNITDSAVKSFEAIGKMITEISESASAVAAAIEEQTAASREIASSAERASTGVDGMVGDINTIDAGIAEIDTTMSEMSKSTDSLAVHSKENIESLMKKMSSFMIELKKIS